MRNPIVSIGIAIALAVAWPVAAQTTGTAPGTASTAEVIKVTATITDIDKVTRDVTLKGPQGKTLTLTAGPGVKNFANLKVGSQANVEYLQGVTVELLKGNTRVVSRTNPKEAVSAKPGEKPAGVVGRTVTIVANVVATDPPKQTITLKGLQQRTVDLRIPVLEQFKRIAVGDQVQAWYTQAVALSVEPLAKK